MSLLTTEPRIDVHQNRSLETLTSGRVMSRALAKVVGGNERLALARAFGVQLVTAWWRATIKGQGGCEQLRPFIAPFEIADLPDSAAVLASEIGETAAQFDPETAAYQIGLAYTGMLPPERRSEHGVFYTPPMLTARLIENVETTGTDWETARVLDPACGGGAFLTPVAQKIIDALPGCDPAILLGNLGSRLRGYEIDPFGAWLSQVSLDVLTLRIARKAGRALPVVVRVCDSLLQTAPRTKFDLVIGNPPYGRVKLDPNLREHYRRGLFGHANLYGLFTDVALRHAKVGGTVAFVTPTSFMAGEYFKNLRSLLGRIAPPVSIDFVTTRRGVFDDVLQETLLATYQRGGTVGPVAMSEITPDVSELLRVHAVGAIDLPADLSSPWLLPRDRFQAPLVNRLAQMPNRLSDWGYTVSTGPLVWNRFKDQMAHRPGRNRKPLVWAESVTSDGRFIFSAKKRNHAPYFEVRERDDWLLVREPCVLLQRTTAKEQARRLIAACLPESFIAKNGGAVIIENHLNMLKPIDGPPKVNPSVLAAFLNSEAADKAFRCVSGSVAVSAYELKALPLPSVDKLRELSNLVTCGAEQCKIEAACAALYERACI
jgi:adenine-specific DNA-methyltransferase